MITKGDCRFIGSIVSLDEGAARVQKVNGDEIIKLDDGSLTTVYHFMKNSNTEINEVLEDATFENAEGVND